MHNDSNNERIIRYPQNTSKITERLNIMFVFTILLITYRHLYQKSNLSKKSANTPFNCNFNLSHDFRKYVIKCTLKFQRTDWKDKCKILVEVI